MKFSELKFICDENVDSEAIDFMRRQDIDAIGVKKLKLSGKDDEEILKRAYKAKRVILTHDSDFGKIIYSGKVDFVGVIYIRPGHFDGKFTIHVVKALMKAGLAFQPPFILVAEQKSDSIKVRLRNNL